MEKLAIFGGSPVSDDQNWPVWPSISRSMLESATRTIASGRWTVSWPSLGEYSEERKFAESFSRYIGTEFAVAVDHGSSAILLALQALGIGPGDEVVVPVMTWVASASAVLRAGATPIFADVHPKSGCVSAEDIEKKITGRTKAVVVVHLACTVAGMDEIMSMASRRGVLLIEDCAQAHGAEWKGKRVGSLGVVGAFSFQQGKVLPAGEGGIVTTDDPEIYDRLQGLRADSRSYVGEAKVPEIGEKEISPRAGMMGANFCMLEVAASLLSTQLPHLDAQHAAREESVRFLQQALDTGGIWTQIPVSPEVTRRSIYELGLQFDKEVFRTCSVEQICLALSAELGRSVYPPDIPLYRSVYYSPESNPLFKCFDAGKNNPAHFVGAEEYRSSTVLFHHSTLLCQKAKLRHIVEAVNKISDCTEQVAAIEVVEGKYIA